MKSTKTLFILIGVFVVLVLSGGLLIWRSSSPRMADRPLMHVEPTDIEKVSITISSETVVLIQNENEWAMVSPVEDWVDKTAIDRLVGTLTSFSLEGVISSDPERYPTFEIQDERATKIEVYKKGNNQPEIKLLLGKGSPTFGASYVRFPDKNEVYVARDFPTWVLNKSGNDYREKQVFRLNWDAVQKISFSTGEDDFSLSKSTDTWMIDKTNSPAEAVWANELVSQLRNWRTFNFDFGGYPPAMMKLDSPTMTIQITEGENNTYKLNIGNTVLPVGKEKPSQRFAQVEGRPAIFYVNISQLDEIAKQLDKVKTQ